MPSMEQPERSTRNRMLPFRWWRQLEGLHLAAPLGNYNQQSLGAFLTTMM